MANISLPLLNSLSELHGTDVVDVEPGKAARQDGHLMIKPDENRRDVDVQALSTAPAHTQTSCWWGGAPNRTQTARLVHAIV
jgi:hypothetical protein